MTSIPDSPTRRAVIYAPHGRDAGIAQSLLDSVGLRCAVCATYAEFIQSLDEDAWFAVVTDDALQFADLREIASKLSTQPPWSDLPFVILTRRGYNAEGKLSPAVLHEVANNVTILERPFHPATFVSIAQTVYRSRQRQFEARARMEELHEGEERLRTALLAGRLGTWELDVTSSALTASAACKALFGYATEAPFTVEALMRTVAPEDRDALRRALDATVAVGSDMAVECRVLRADGSVRWADLRARLVRDRSGGRPRLVGVASDITDRALRQDALTRLNELLETRVAERTTQLTQAHAAVVAEMEQRERAEEQLRQAQKMEMIGQLTGGVAHDFNNLLMAVLGNLELLRKHVSHEPRPTALLDRAMQGAQRGAALTQRLLAFARRQDLHVQPRSLVELVRGAADLIERSAGTQIELRLDLPDGLPLALMDANQIELAVLNLVVNARDAMTDGGVLSIAVDRPDSHPDELPPGEYLRLAVRDTGHGMDATTLKRATEPFFSTKEIGKGTGLGLSMVHGLAVQLNGTLRLESEVGVGTTAELWLPVTTVPAAEVRRASPEPARTLLEKIRILVVDDDALIAMSTVEMLRDLGHDVVEADCGERALAILREDRAIEVLVTDFSMPRMNGAQLAGAARQIRPDLPILLATGYAELPDGTAPGLPRIDKPYHQDELAAGIAAVLTQARAAPAAAD